MRYFVVSLILFSLIFSGCQQQTLIDTAAEDSNVASKTTKVTLEVVAENTGVDEADTVNTDYLADGIVYKDFSEEDYEGYNGIEPFILFFYSGLSPASVQMEKTFMEETTSFPEGTVILKADYNSETGLRDEYGVNAESTVLVFNSTGNLIYTAQDPPLDDFIAAIERSMEP